GAMRRPALCDRHRRAAQRPLRRRARGVPARMRRRSQLVRARRAASDAAVDRRRARAPRAPIARLGAASSILKHASRTIGLLIHCVGQKSVKLCSLTRYTCHRRVAAFEQRRPPHIGRGSDEEGGCVRSHRMRARSLMQRRTSMDRSMRATLVVGLVTLVSITTLPPVIAEAQTRTNQTAGCPGNIGNYNPGNGEDIVVPKGYKVERFSKIDLNFPTGIAFLGNKNDFKVLIQESGHGLPSRCNDREDPAYGGAFSATNPFTPDILVLDKNGNKVAGPFAKPTGPDNGFQADGPAIDIAFENKFQGGRLFATDSNQSLRTAGRNNSSRIVIVDINANTVTPFITGLPTGDHPAEQLEFKDGFIYWSQGSTTNSGVVGLDNGGGTNQQDIPCQDIVLSQHTFPSPGGVRTSGYSPHGVQRPGETVKAFASATSPG